LQALRKKRQTEAKVTIGIPQTAVLEDDGAAVRPAHCEVRGRVEREGYGCTRLPIGEESQGQGLRV